MRGGRVPLVNRYLATSAIALVVGVLLFLSALAWSIDEDTWAPSALCFVGSYVAGLAALVYFMLGLTRGNGGSDGQITYRGSGDDPRSGDDPSNHGSTAA